MKTQACKALGVRPHAKGPGSDFRLQHSERTRFVVICYGSPKILTRPLSTPAPFLVGGPGVSVEIW